MNNPTMSKPLRRAFALSYAMRARPTPELATVYFDALRQVLGDGAPPVAVAADKVRAG